MLLGAGLAPLSAQVQESKVQEKLFGKPDMSLEFVPRSFSGEKVLKEFKTSDMKIKPFLFRERFSSKEFKTAAFSAKAYEAKDFVSGKKAFETKDGLANWRHSAAPTDLVKDATGLKDFSVKGARESDKENSNDSKTYATKTAVMEGKGQKDLDRQYKEAPALTIDQVRELLNKSP